MKPIPFAEINRELVPKDPLETMKYGTALAEKCRLGHNAEPPTPEGNRRRKSLWLPRIRAACAIRAQAMLSLPRPRSEHDIVFDRHRFLKTNDGKAIFHSIDENKIFVSSDLSIPKELDPLEDFTTYTEYDPQSRFTVTSSQITGSNVLRSDAGYVYRDCGAGYFSDFTHYNEVRIIGISGSSGDFAFVIVWALSNSLAGSGTWYDTRAQAIRCAFYYYTSTSQFKYGIYDYETRVSDTTVISSLTTYYVTIERSGSTFIAYLYTDSGRTSLFDTLSMSITASRTYRYVLGVNTNNSDYASPAISFTAANLDLNPISFQPTWAEGINTHHF